MLESMQQNQQVHLYYWLVRHRHDLLWDWDIVHTFIICLSMVVLIKWQCQSTGMQRKHLFSRLQVAVLFEFIFLSH